MKLTRLTIALYMAVVFLAGGVVGALGYRLYTVSTVSANVAQRNPDEYRKRFQAEMKSRLKLTDDQASKLDTIMEETRARFRATRASIEPEMKMIREDQQQRIREMLTHDQQAEWEKIMAERQKERENKKRGGRPPQ